MRGVTGVGLLAVALLLGCRDPTAPAVDCRGELEVTITVTRFGADTAVVCAFPADTVTPPPPEKPCRHRHRGHPHCHHGHGGHDD